jgi:hypothetical protein
MAGADDADEMHDPFENPYAAKTDVLKQGNKCRALAVPAQRRPGD